MGNSILPHDLGVVHELEVEDMAEYPILNSAKGIVAKLKVVIVVV